MKHSFVSVRIVDVIDETPEAKSFVLEFPHFADIDPGYKPGQFMTFRIPVPEAQIMRCYSMSSSPLCDPLPKVTVKRVPGGIGSNWICDNLGTGDHIDVLPPAGVFSPSSLNDDLLLFAAGSGITPVISILKSSLIGGAGRVLLIYANRDRPSVIFDTELELLEKQFPNRLIVRHWLDSLLGFPSTSGLVRLAEGWSQADCFICGPEAFMDVAEAAVKELGVNGTRVHSERFTFEENESARNVSGGESVQLDVSIDGEIRTLSWPPNQRLLDVLLNAGIHAPYSCRMAACGACACQLLEGEVKLLNNDVLENSDMSEGWILACQAVPVSRRVVISFR